MKLNFLMVLIKTVFWCFTKFHKGITEIHKINFYCNIYKTQISQIFTDYVCGLMKLNALMVIKKTMFFGVSQSFTKESQRFTKSLLIAISIKHIFHKFSQIMRAS